MQTCATISVVLANSMFVVPFPLFFFWLKPAIVVRRKDHILQRSFI